MKQSPTDQRSWRQIDWDTIEAEVARFNAVLATRRLH